MKMNVKFWQYTLIIVIAFFFVLGLGVNFYIGNVTLDDNLGNLEGNQIEEEGCMFLKAKLDIDQRLSSSSWMSNDYNFIYVPTATNLQAYSFDGLILSNTFEVGDKVNVPQLDTQGNIYFGSENKNFYSIGSDFIKKFEFITAGKIKTVADIEELDSGLMVYFASTDKKLYALDGLGNNVWEYLSEEAITSYPVVDQGYVYFGDKLGNLHKVGNGVDVVEPYNMEVSIISRPFVFGDLVFAANSKGVYALYKDDLSLKWMYDLEDKGFVLSALNVIEDKLYVGTTTGDFFVFDELNGGNPLWIASLGSPIKTMAVVLNNVVYFGANNGVIYAYNINTGQLMDTYDTDDAEIFNPDYDSPVNTPYVFDKDGIGYLVVTSEEGIIYKFDINGCGSELVEQELGLGLPCASGLGNGNECTDSSGVKVGHCNEDLICGGEGAVCYPAQNKLCASGLSCDSVAEICVEVESEEVTCLVAVGTLQLGEICEFSEQCAMNLDCLDGMCNLAGDIIEDNGITGNVVYDTTQCLTSNNQFNVGGDVFRSLWVGKNNELFVPSLKGILYSYNLDGTKNWEYSINIAGSNVKSKIYTTPYVDDLGNVYFAGDNKKLYSLDSLGNLRFVYQGSSVVKVQPYVYNGLAFYGGEDGYIVGLNIDGANIGMREYDLSTGSSVTPFFGYEDSLYFGSGTNIYKIVMGSPNYKDWNKDTGADVKSMPIVYNDLIYVTTKNGVYSYDLDGNLVETLATFDGSFDVISPLNIINNWLLVAAMDGNLYAYNLVDSRSWIYNTGASMQTWPQEYNGIVYVGDDSGFVYAVNLDTGEFVNRYDTKLGSTSTKVKVHAPFVVGDDLAIVTEGGNLYNLDISGCGSELVEQELGLGLPCADSLEEESQCADESEVNVGYCSRNLICGGEGAICYDNVMCANGLTCDLVYEWCVPIVEGCITDTDCTNGRKCLDYQGNMECRFEDKITLLPSNCGDGFGCVIDPNLVNTGLCIPVAECSVDTDCDSALSEVCVEGICTTLISQEQTVNCKGSGSGQFGEICQFNYDCASGLDCLEGNCDVSGEGMDVGEACVQNTDCKIGLLCNSLGLGLPCASGLGNGNECTDSSGVKVGHCNEDLICGGEGAVCYPAQNKLCASGLSCDSVTEICVGSGVGIVGPTCQIDLTYVYDIGERYDNGICGEGNTCDVSQGICVVVQTQEPVTTPGGGGGSSGGGGGGSSGGGGGGSSGGGGGGSVSQTDVPIEVSEGDVELSEEVIGAYAEETLDAETIGDIEEVKSSLEVEASADVKWGVIIGVIVVVLGFLGLGGYMLYKKGIFSNKNSVTSNESMITNEIVMKKNKKHH